MVCLPLHLLAIPRAEPDWPPATGPTFLPASEGGAAEPGAGPGAPPTTTVFALLATILVLMGLIPSVVSVHLLALLGLRRLDPAAAVALGALIGPAQVGSRLLGAVVGQRLHPLWTMTTSVALVAAGLVLLLLDAPLPALAVVLCGAGNGLHTIARGAVPLVFFSFQRYAPVMGRLAWPSLVIQALAPPAGAWLPLGDGAPMLVVLTVLGVGGLGLCWALLCAVSRGAGGHLVWGVGETWSREATTGGLWACVTVPWGLVSTERWPVSAL